jgi:cell shape-determining protein MreD
MLLAATIVVVFVQSAFNGLRYLLGAQVDLLPSLLVYAALTQGLPAVTLVAVSGGLWFDSLSSNPLGISVLPLFLISLVIYRCRGLVLRSEVFAQVALGLAASAATPVLTLLLLINVDRQPLLGWFSLWQWCVVTVAGGVMTPAWFKFFDWINRALNYRPWGETTFRSDREIKRGRQ